MIPWTVVGQTSLSLDFQGKNTGVGCIFFSRRSSQPRDWTVIFCIAGKFFTTKPPGRPSIDMYIHKNTDGQRNRYIDKQIDKQIRQKECLKNYGRRFVTLYRRRWPNHAKEKEMEKGKMVVWGGHTSIWGKKRSKRQRRKGKTYPTECKVAENGKERKRSLLKWTMQKERERKRKTVESERLEITSRILEILREHFMQRWAQ